MGRPDLRRVHQSGAKPPPGCPKRYAPRFAPHMGNIGFYRPDKGFRRAARSRRLAKGGLGAALSQDCAGDLGSGLRRRRFGIFTMLGERAEAQIEADRKAARAARDQVGRKARHSGAPSYLGFQQSRNIGDTSTRIPPPFFHALILISTSPVLQNIHVSIQSGLRASAAATGVGQLVISGPPIADG